MAGIYIHIPFCKQACSYCDFHFSTNLSRKQDVLSAILQEIKLRSEYLNGNKIETIYFGGGTPSLLNKQELETLFEQLHKYFTITANAEITLEANPDDLSVQKLQELRNSPVNRLSIGVQSFFNEDLQFMNRAHSADEALSSIKTAQDFGFENLNIDLIFGGQTTTDEMWQQNLSHFFALNIPHLSAYSLTIEEKTALFDKVKKGKLPPTDDAKNYRQYLQLQAAIKAKGFEQYELSNYCKNGLLSKHNTSYWFGTNYLGLGPSAHSFNGTSRQWNVSNNIAYQKALHTDNSYFEKEELSETDRYHEFLITALRTKWGIKLSEINFRFSDTIQTHFKKKLKKLNQEKILLDSTKLVVKNNFLFQSDELVRELMI